MKLIATLILSALVLTGCDRVGGQLNVTNDFNLKNSNGNSQSLKVGTYNAELSQSTFGKRIILKLNNDQNQKYDFKIPDGTKLPSNGTFLLKSNEIGQPVDLQGVVDTKITDSDVREDYQSCSYSEPYTVCSPSGPNGQTTCSVYYRTIIGSQWTRYYDRNLDEHVTLTIAPANTTNAVAEFLGHATNVQRIIVNQSPCR
jgi:hypothetical protein